jgi:hypothetical protein
MTLASGQLGDGSTTQITRPSTTDRTGASSADVVIIAVGAHHTCTSASSDEYFSCWGRNSDRQVLYKLMLSRVTVVSVVCLNFQQLSMLMHALNSLACRKRVAAARSPAATEGAAAAVHSHCPSQHACGFARLSRATLLSYRKQQYIAQQGEYLCTLLMTRLFVPACWSLMSLISSLCIAAHFCGSGYVRIVAVSAKISLDKQQSSCEHALRRCVMLQPSVVMSGSAEMADVFI